MLGVAAGGWLEPGLYRLGAEELGEDGERAGEELTGEEQRLWEKQSAARAPRFIAQTHPFPAYRLR